MTVAQPIQCHHKHSRTDAADKTKMDGIELAQPQTRAAEIKTAYENNSDTNAFTDALAMNAIDQRTATTMQVSTSDTNAFTDALQTKLNGIATQWTAVGT